MPPSYREIDRVLGSDPQFGAAEVIEARNIARYRLGLTLLSRHHPESAERFGWLAKADDAALRPYLYDPVLRNAFENDLVNLELQRTQPSALAEYLAYAGTDRGDGLGPCERLMEPHYRPWPGRGRAWVWTDVRPKQAAHPLAARLDELREGTLAEMRATRRVSPDAAMLEGLTRGAELLAELLPHAGAGVFPHISLIGLAQGETDDGQLYSLSGGDPLPSALLVAPEHLAKPWKTAEILFHEGLHLKQFEVLRTGSLVADPDRMTDIPWRVVPWDLRRVIAAFHVYAHMVLFFAAAEEAPAELRARFGEPPSDEDVGVPTPGSLAAAEGGYTTSKERAAFLGRQALLAHGDALTPAGRRFVQWMLDAIEPLAPGTRVDGPAAGPAAEPVAAAPVPEPDPRGYRKVEPVGVCPLPELGQLLAVAPASRRFHWLNEHAWLIYALCDGRGLEEIRASYREQLGEDGPLAAGIAGLVEAGLVEPVAG
ncbi:aKG-HExxH-type peptide beta-hydroxylase [Kitasatospora camelliae]|uniref:HEXXH motif-containing putative peptide modification protein n=1 Tax=Kitasatospora camelliae TaxID=3156397 RepID=A0AAU8JY70_9ACTN